jgi:YD repeat-containing protein
VTLTTGYDNLGQTTSYTHATGTTSTTAYDIDSNVATVTDGQGTTSYTYDSSSEHRGLVTGEDIGVSLAPSAFSASYDAAGNLATQTYPNGLVASTSYDNGGNPTKLVYAKSGSTWMTFTATNGDGDRTVAQTSPHSAQSFGYDQDGRLTTVQDTYSGACTTRTYSFDTHSNRTGLDSYPPPTGGGCSTSTTPAAVHTTFDQGPTATPTLATSTTRSAAPPPCPRPTPKGSARTQQPPAT